MSELKTPTRDELTGILETFRVKYPNSRARWLAVRRNTTETKPTEG